MGDGEKLFWAIAAALGVACCSVAVYVSVSERAACAQRTCRRGEPVALTGPVCVCLEVPK